MGRLSVWFMLVALFTGVSTLPAHASPYRVFPSRERIEVEPGGIAETSWYVLGEHAPIAGYSIVLSVSESAGSHTPSLVNFDEVRSSFDPLRNLFIADGIPLDPTFSFIDVLSDGRFVATALPALGEAVSPEPSHNDSLAFVSFRVLSPVGTRLFVSPTAGTSFIDVDGGRLPHTTDTLEIIVVPSPGSVIIVLAVSGLIRSRRYTI